jgi:hypothetical protein
MHTFYYARAHMQPHTHTTARPPARTRARTHTHARTHAGTHAQTHTHGRTDPAHTDMHTHSESVLLSETPLPHRSAQSTRPSASQTHPDSVGRHNLYPTDKRTPYSNGRRGDSAGFADDRASVSSREGAMVMSADSAFYMTSVEDRCVCAHVCICMPGVCAPMCVSACQVCVACVHDYLVYICCA